ncbi:MAG: hypothetical protein ACJ76H_07255 [Bacteriovoracaceae bacterium]
MKKIIFMSALFALTACSQMAPNSTGREPNQYRGDDHRDRDHDNRPGDNRWDNNRPGNGWGDRNHNRDWRRRADNRRCVHCFDMRSYNDVVRLGNEVSLISSSYPTENTGYVIPTQCGIRSVSIEVLDNEAHIAGIQVHYAGDSMFQWDTLPIQQNWDIRNADEGENSIWFDVGSPRQNDRACIDRVKVIGFTYKDMYDYGWAQVQFYGSRSIRGATDYGRPVPGPGPAPMPIPTTWIDEKRVELDPALSCIQGLPNVNHPDEMHSDSLFGSSKLLGRCSNARDNKAVRDLQFRGYLCNVDAMNSLGRTNPDCVNNVMSKIAKQDKITSTHRFYFTKYCSGEIWVCTKTMSR